MIKRISKGVATGLLPVAALWGFALWQRTEDPLGWGMAILPLVLISIVLFVLVFALFLLASKQK